MGRIFYSCLLFIVSTSLPKTLKGFPSYSEGNSSSMPWPTCTLWPCLPSPSLICSLQPHWPLGCCWNPPSSHPPETWAAAVPFGLYAHPHPPHAIQGSMTLLFNSLWSSDTSPRRPSLTTLSPQATIILNLLTPLDVSTTVSTIQHWHVFIYHLLLPLSQLALSPNQHTKTTLEQGQSLCSSLRLGIFVT